MSELNPLLSSRALNTPASPIRKLVPLAEAAEQRGTEVIPLNIGQPDLSSPPAFNEAFAAFHTKTLAYETSQGNRALRSNWSDFINRQIATELEPENLLITNGASEALVMSFMICCDPGSEIIIFDPTYANYQGFAAIAGVKLVGLPTALSENFSLPPRTVISTALTANTRAILLCNPNNPSGKVYSKEEVELLIDICAEHDLFLIVDETYRDLVFDQQKFYSALSAVGLFQNRIIVIDSLSKRFSLCGARLGCLITKNKTFMQAALNFAQARLASSTAAQVAAATMFETISPDYITDACREYQNRRDFLYYNLSKIRDCEVSKPQGGFYLIIDLPVDSAEEFARFLLNDFSWQGQTVFIAPAAGFYCNAKLGKTQARLAAVLSVERMQNVPEILERGLLAYRNQVMGLD